jgi:hypothetical protein
MTEPMPVVLMAGKDEASKFSEMLDVARAMVWYREFYEFGADKFSKILTDNQTGETMPALEHVIRHLSHAENVRYPIHIVGNSKAEKLVSRLREDSDFTDLFEFLPQKSTYAQNANLGREKTTERFGLSETDYMLFLSADLLRLESTHLDQFIAHAREEMESPLGISYIRKETMEGFRRKYLRVFEDRGLIQRRDKVKESNVVVGNGIANLDPLDRLYGMRKMLMPQNWLKLFQLIQETNGTGTINLASGISRDFLTRGGVRTSRIEEGLPTLLDQDCQLIEVLQKELSLDYDSRKDAKRLGYSFG